MSFAKHAIFIAVWTLAIGCLLAPSTGEAEERKAFDFYGAIPGLTTEVELLQMEAWGRLVESSTRPDGAKLLRFRVGRWDPIHVLVLDGLITMIDAVPPKGTEPDKLAEVLRLGKVAPIDMLPETVRFGLPVPAQWKPVKCSDGLGLMFTANEGERAVVKLLRFYADIPPMPAMLGVGLRRPSSEKLKQLKLSSDVLEVENVVPESAAEAGGVRLGDVIVEFDGKPPGEVKAFTSSIPTMPIGSSHNVRLLRDGKEVDVKVTLKRMPLYVAFYNRGGVHFSDENYDDAIADLTRSLKISPNNPSGYFSRGACYARKGDVDQAIANYNDAIRLAPGNLNYVLNRGRLYASQRKFAKALSDFDEVIRAAPGYADAYRDRSAVHRELGNLDRADADLRKSQELAIRSSAEPIPRNDTPGSGAREVDILAFDRELQNQPIQTRTEAIEEFQSKASDALSKGNTYASAQMYWNARQLLVEKTVPSCAWVLLGFEVTDGAHELQHFKTYFGKVNALDFDCYYAGVRVRRVLPGGRAAQAGLLPGDQLLKINEREISEFKDVDMTFFVTAPKETTRLTVRDLGGKDRTIEIRGK